MAEGRRLSPRSGIFDGIHTLTPQTIVYVGSDGEVIPLNLGNGLSISNNTLNVTGGGSIDANAINVGTGVGLYKQKVDSDLHFKTLVGNSKMVIDLVGQDEVRLNVVNVADQVHTHSITDVLNLQSSLDAKVDVVAGKGLSTNDFSHVYRDLVDMTDQYMEETGSGLHVSGGEITLTGGIGFNISAGVGYALTPLGELVRVTWPLISSTCQNDGDNYMTIDYQGNLVQYSSTAGHENIRLGYVRTGANNSVVVGFSNVKFTGAHHLYNINQWASTLLGSLVDDGCNLALKPSPNNLEVAVASGRVWAQFNKYDINDTDTFTKIFNTAIGYVPDNVSTPNQIVLGVYNNSSAAPASALVPMTPGYYKKDMFFITVEGTLFYVYGTAEYSTLEAAKAAPVPAAPDNIKNQIVRVGAVVSQEGATEIAELQDIRPIFARLFDVGFVASNATVIDHGDLVGLGDDDHVLYHTDVRGDARYYRKDQIDPMMNNKEDFISAGTTAQYYRGDKTFQDLTKSSVGLGNVDNTSDANKPISTATQSALDVKQPLDSNLTDIAALLAVNDDIIQRKAGVWTNRTPVQLKADLSLTKTDVGLGNVDNTSDVNKPISTATQTALNGKQPLDQSLTELSALTPTNDDVFQYKAGAWTNRTPVQLKADLSLSKTDVGLGNVDNTSDVNKPISTATQTALDGKENTISVGTTAQYYRGDKTFQDLTKSSVGLNNVDNTSDVNKPISAATQTALDGKQATLVSGTNIKTINGTTLIGSGNLTVSATPAGSSTHIQFNSGGTLAGSPDFTWDDTTKSLSLLGADTEILMQGITNEPAAAPAGALRLYTKSIAGRMLPKWVGPSGVDTPMQANIGFNRAVWVIPNTTTSVTAMGIAVTNTGTLATPTLTSTNTLSSVKRTTFTTTATAGSLAGTRSPADVWRGNAEGRGGFFITIRFGVSALQAGNRAFLGLETTAAAPTNIDPLTSTTNGRIGVGINANTGNWNLVHNVAGTAPTVVDLGANFPVNVVDLYELALFAAPNGSAVGYRVKKLSTGGETSGTIATNIPSSTTFMAIQMWITNNATAAAAGLAMSKIYLETDL